MIRNGFFGFQDYLKALCDAVDGEGGDYYLIGKDFIPYLEAQVFFSLFFICLFLFLSIEDFFES